MVYDMQSIELYFYNIYFFSVYYSVQYKVGVQ